MPPEGETRRESYFVHAHQIVILVDPYSTGCVLAKEMMKRNYSIMALWTNGFSEEMKTHVPGSCGKMEYYCEIDEGETLEETAKIVNEASGEHVIVACLAGGEAGVDLADARSPYV